MAQHQARWPVSVMCAVMPVSRSGFEAYVQRHAPACVGAEEAALLARVKTIATETRQSYGRRRMAKQLQADGFAVGRYKARRLMRPAELTVQRRNQRHPVTTDSRPGDMVAPNLLARQFAVEELLGQIAVLSTTSRTTIERPASAATGVRGDYQLQMSFLLMFWSIKP